MKTKHTCRASAGRLFCGQSIIRWCQTRHLLPAAVRVLICRDENVSCWGRPTADADQPGDLDRCPSDRTHKADQGVGRPIRSVEGRSGVSPVAEYVHAQIKLLQLQSQLKENERANLPAYGTSTPSCAYMRKLFIVFFSLPIQYLSGEIHSMVNYVGCCFGCAHCDDHHPFHDDHILQSYPSIITDHARA
jgi:hypothetical protein